VSDRTYSLDANVFIESWRRLYRPRTFATFWERFDEGIEAGTLRATEEVKVEIWRRDDELKRWLKDRLEVFVPHEEDIQIALRSALGPCERMLGSHKGHNAADPWVIALAMARGMTVVTLEGLTGNASKPRVPDVCEQLGVPWTNLADFIDEQNWTM
jgi:hypothetical protein